jgi:hypothetical protein
VCVDKNACGSNGRVQGINVDYYCVCEPHFVGKYCERMGDGTESAFKPQLVDNKSILDATYCIYIQTQCINGDPQTTKPEPICG